MKAKICIKCGAPLRSSKCEYCGTEYKLDDDNNVCQKGRKVNEYIYELDIDGTTHKFYVSDLEVNPIFCSAGRNKQGNLVCDGVVTKRKIELIEV